MKRLILVFFALSLLPYVAAAKRVAPAKVEPVIHEGIRYVAPNDDGRRAYIEAWDVQTNKKVWELTVFTNPIDLNLEEDVQWFFIDGLSIRDGRLMVKSEGGQMYEVDLKTKAITRFDSVAASPEVSREIPKTVKKAIANGSLPKDYDISFQMEPFYLQADFNGDRKVDVAVLVRQRSTGKFGIAIIHGGMSRAAILGAGISIGNGGDDFEWMDSWRVYSRRREASDTNGQRLHGDALLVSKSEAGSALIYWNGKRYVWFQQGD